MEGNKHIQVIKCLERQTKNGILCNGKVTAHILAASDCIINKTVERVIPDIRCIENLAGRPVKDLEL